MLQNFRKKHRMVGFDGNIHVLYLYQIKYLLADS